MSDQLVQLFDIKNLFKTARIDGMVDGITPLFSGGNNRLYKVSSVDQTYILKHYFNESTDARDRLGSEVAFITYASTVTKERVPQLLSYDKQAGVALFEYVDGKSLTSVDIDQSAIIQASDFFCELNSKNRIGQNSIPLASEACFSIEEHFNLIRRRVSQLLTIPALDTDDYDAKNLAMILHDALTDYQRYVVKFYSKQYYEPIRFNLRCISPSDFGFHNALKTNSSRFRFLDFEYAGWDDPAKMIGDFFSQLAVPIPLGFFDLFVNQCLSVFDEINYLTERAHLLHLLYQIKWCTIALNIFIPINLRRRQFANPNLDITQFKKQQLVKAQKLMANVLETKGKIA